MHITLINPPMISTYDGDFYLGRKGAPPLNLAYLASIIVNAGHDYEVIDAMACTDRSTFNGWTIYGISLQSIVEKISSETDVVGITAMFTSEWALVRELSKLIKKKLPTVTLIIGGEHATCDAKNIITFEPTIDLCFSGEAEVSFEEFLKIHPHKNYELIKGITYRDQTGKAISTTQPTRLKSLDHTSPRWEKIPVHFYLENKLSYSQIGRVSMPILATRGCPYTCTFCTNEIMWGTTYAKRSPESIVAEMKLYQSLFGVEHFDFIDLAMAINKAWLKDLCILIQKEIPNISWEMTVGTRSEILDEEILELLMKSGNTVICYAPETGSSTMAQKIQKRINFKKFYKSVNLAVNAGFDVKANLIIGFPSESLYELVATLFMSLRLGFMGVKGVSIFKFTPFPGSRLGEKKFPKQCGSLEEYEKIITRETGEGGAKVVNIFHVFKNPGDQTYAFLTNVSMVMSYLICALRRPKYLKQFFINLKKGTPIAPVEVAVYSLLRKYLK